MFVAYINKPASVSTLKGKINRKKFQNQRSMGINYRLSQSQASMEISIEILLPATSWLLVLLVFYDYRLLQFVNLLDF
jgi:hypothetical protein